MKQKKKLRNVNVTKVLHKNIETLAAAKVMKNEGRFALKDLRTKGQHQLKFDSVEKKRKCKNKVDTELRHLENAKKKTERS